MCHAHVDRKSAGFVYLKFELQEAAAAAQKALHGRWFAKRKIACAFQFTQVYDTHFQI